MTNVTSLAFRFGLILGGVSIVWALILYLMDMHDSLDRSLQIVGAIISIVVIVFGLLEFRKRNGFLTLPQSIKMAIIISLISTIIFIIYYFILTEYMDPGMVERQIDEMMDQFRAKNPEVSDEMIDGYRKGQEMSRKPLLFVGAALIFSVLSGLIFGLIAGLILKRKKEENLDDLIEE